MPGALFLEGEKVNLRTVEKEDLEFLRDTYNLEQVRKFVGNRHPANLKQEQEFFEGVVCKEESTDLIICSEEEPIGMISVIPDNKDIQVAEIGLWLHPDHHGNGYGTEASKLIIEHAFNERNFHKLFARVYSSNEPSQRLWEKLEFTKEGELREQVYKDGEFENVYLYGILKTEWF